jgi:cobalamin biosynthesis Co2+ chelatase CbiK
MQYYSISRDINNHFSKFKQYTYGNNTFYNKKDYESFINSINYEKKYKIIPIDNSTHSKK